MLVNVVYILSETDQTAIIVGLLLYNSVNSIHTQNCKFPLNFLSFKVSLYSHVLKFGFLCVA